MDNLLGFLKQYVINFGIFKLIIFKCVCQVFNNTLLNYIIILLYTVVIIFRSNNFFRIIFIKTKKVPKIN